MKIEGTTLTIDLTDIIHECLDDLNNTETMQSISCNELVIKNVMAQVLDGCTDDGYSGSESILSNDRRAMQEFRAEIARRSSEVVAKEIERLEKVAKYYKDKHDEKNDHEHDWESRVLNGYKWVKGFWTREED